MARILNQRSINKESLLNKINKHSAQQNIIMNRMVANTLLAKDSTQPHLQTV
jgi:hypothetical protein